MAEYVASPVVKGMIKKKDCSQLRYWKLFNAGYYKEKIADVRNTKLADHYRCFVNYGVTVAIYDYLQINGVKEYNLSIRPMDCYTQRFDAVVSLGVAMNTFYGFFPFAKDGKLAI
jgi:UDP-N-acetyl-D-mannosaminuronate dehydrogenase